MKPQFKPTGAGHKKQADRNADLAEKLVDIGSPPFYDWVITVSFYAALHYVSSVFEKYRPLAYFYDKQQSISGDLRGLARSLNKTAHSLTNEILKRNFQGAFFNYDPLWRMADNSRYWCYECNVDEAKEALRRMKEIRKWARDFKQTDTTLPAQK